MAKLPDDVAIRVENIHKDFHLPHNNEDSIKHRMITLFEKKDQDIDTLHALKGVSFDIKKGEFFGILGRNGSGKSTLLKLISQIYQPTRGRVRHRGRLVAFIELGVGFNPQLTGRENVYLNGALLGFSRSEIDAMYDDIVSFAELENFMEQKLKNYSSGMKVRLAFSVAIRADADILILDEVLAVGDADFQRKCYNYFKELKEREKTVVLVTHGMGAVREYCDKAILIEDGVIAHAGTADEIADEYLKMFNKSASGGAESNRWGDGSVRMHDFKFKLTKTAAELSVKLIAGDNPMNDVKFGFRIKDEQGKVIAGANNLNVVGAEKMSFAAGEQKVLHFSMPNILGNGTYSLSATVNLSDGTTTCDSWDNIETLTNTNDQAFYPLVFPATLSIM
jgi:ABC-2 type transport system ATP-binding protein